MYPVPPTTRTRLFSMVGERTIDWNRDADLQATSYFITRKQRFRWVVLPPYLFMCAVEIV
jgi:hypothetical protein